MRYVRLRTTSFAQYDKGRAVTLRERSAALATGENGASATSAVERVYQGVKVYYVYMMTTKNNRVLYIGVTGDLERRVRQHQSGEIEGFTQKYHVKKLVYYEECQQVKDAIAREKQLKKWTRAKKEELIRLQNPEWIDLSKE